MVNFQCLLMVRNATKLTPRLRSLQNLIFQRARYVAFALYPMFPNTTATLFNASVDLSRQSETRFLISSLDNSPKFFRRYSSLTRSVKPRFLYDSSHHVFCDLLVIFDLRLIVAQ